MGPSQLAVKMHKTIPTVSAPTHGQPARPARLGRRGLGLAALAATCAAIGYLLRPGAVTDDTYAFLDWGRDLRHGFLPLLEHRTFQPLPLSAGAAVSFAGSAAPTVAILMCLAALVLLAVAPRRVVARLRFCHPGAALPPLLFI